jgi:hypothetical protein
VLAAYLRAYAELGLYSPYGIFCDATHLVVADNGNHGVLIWNGLPSFSSAAAAADLELGWPTFAATSTQPVAASASTLNGPTTAYFGGGRLYVADRDNHRVLVWNSLPTTSGQAADFVLGQPDFVSSTPGLGAASLNTPNSVVIYKNSLLVGDRGNKRILVWTPLPTRSGEAAHAALGVTALDAAPPAVGDRTGFFAPRYLAVTNGRLFVTDGNRVVSFLLRN